MNNHLAVQANINSIRFAGGKDKASWLALFDDNAVLRDPVGKSPFDPEGKGHAGIKAIEAFWDNIIDPANISLNVIKRVPSGDRHCASLIIATNTLAEDKQTVVDMLVVYEVNDEGKIVSLAAHWSWDELLGQLKHRVSRNSFNQCDKELNKDRQEDKSCS